MPLCYDSITSNLRVVIDAADHREAPVITFMATASGMSLLGLGSAFWGMMIGVAAYLILHKTNWIKTPRTAPATGQEKG